MNVAEAGKSPVGSGAPARSDRETAGADPAAAPARPKRRKARAFWLKQLHTWHWVSAAISLAGMMLFAITGITLNHAASISARPIISETTGQLGRSVLELLGPSGDRTDPLPAKVAAAVSESVSVNPAGYPADWSGADEVYIAMPGPGRDAWVSIDRITGEVLAETTDRGWISYLNDLHKGRNSGSAWFWFIDVFAVACVLFTVTGFFLLQLHARHRPSTWPLVGVSLAVPVLIALFFIH